VSELKRPNPSEMCPPGYHVVHGHERICHSGTKTWVDAHIRRNPGKIRPGLLKENIYHLYWNSKNKYPPLPQIENFKTGSEYDAAIQFWLAYWKSQGVKFPEDLEPLHIKALMSVESSFNPNAKTKVKGSTAEGLMQITDQSLRVLGGFPNKDDWIEARDHLIHVEKSDKMDALVNIALGVRLLGHKYSMIPKGHPKNVRNTLKAYNQWNEKGDAYADEVLARFKRANRKK